MSDRTRQTGDLVSDNNIFVDIVNDRVGIGTTVATAQLTVAGDINLTSGIITATSGIVTASGGFVGNLTGTASAASFATTAFNLADAADITTGTISSDRLTGYYDIDITGTATTAFNLADAANITTGTISSDRLTGSYAIDITGNADTASTATEFTVTANNSTNETVYPVFVDAATGSQGAETDAALSYNPSTNTLTAGTFNSTSDRKLKENVKVVKNASELINKLEGVNFTWIETGEKSVGVIAQQVESYIPELVSENQEVKSVNYNGLVGILIEAFKEQQRQIEELKEVIQNL
jgi:hypothetical protein